MPSLGWRHPPFAKHRQLFFSPRPRHSGTERPDVLDHRREATRLDYEVGELAPVLTGDPAQGGHLQAQLMSGDYRKIEVITGAARRRRWTTEENLRIVEEREFRSSCADMASRRT